MKSATFSAVSVFLLASFSTSLVSRGANNEPPPGFVALFNGRNLSGWYGWGTEDPTNLWARTPEQLAEYKRQSVEGGLLDKKGKPLNEHINAHWRVENGELVNDGHGLYLTTDKDYGDFELLLAEGACSASDPWQRDSLAQCLHSRNSAGGGDCAPLGQGRRRICAPRQRC